VKIQLDVQEETEASGLRSTEQCAGEEGSPGKHGGNGLWQAFNRTKMQTKGGPWPSYMVRYCDENIGAFQQAGVAQHFGRDAALAPL